MERVSTGFNNHIQTVRMILVPLIMAVPAVVIWHFLYTSGWHSNQSADEPIVNAILPALFGAHVFIAGFMFIRESDDMRRLKRAIKEGDEATFIDIAEDPIPVPMKFVLFTTANIIQGWTISLNYEIYWTGFFANLSVGYVLSLIWEIIADFDDPINGVWVIKGVPIEWVKKTKLNRRFSDRMVEAIIHGSTYVDVTK